MGLNTDTANTRVLSQPHAGMQECVRARTYAKPYTQIFQTRAVTLHFLTFCQAYSIFAKGMHPSVSLSHIITWKTNDLHKQCFFVQFHLVPK